MCLIADIFEINTYKLPNRDSLRNLLLWCFYQKAFFFCKSFFPFNMFIFFKHIFILKICRFIFLNSKTIYKQLCVGRCIVLVFVFLCFKFYIFQFLFLTQFFVIVSKPWGNFLSSVPYGTEVLQHTVQFHAPKLSNKNDLKALLN